MKKQFVSFLSLWVCFLCLSACIKTQKVIGYSLDPEKEKLIKLGETRKAIVRRTLGSPSAVSNYGKETWFYISTEQEYIAFFDPKIKSQNVLAIEFNDNQTVASIKKYNKDDVKNISISSDFTKTQGHDESVMEQLLGNVGRFNTDRADAAN